jgi:ABC-2 type transport system permease protein
MLKSLIFKGLYDKRWFIFGWSLGVAVMVMMVVGFFNSFSQGPEIEQLFSNLPEQLKAFVGDVSTFRNIDGYIGTQLFEIRVPMLTLIMAIVLGIGLSVGEEASGQLDQLLALPLSRPRIVVEKWLTLTAVITIVMAVIAKAIYLSVLLLGKSVGLEVILAPTFTAWLLTLCVGTLSLMLGLSTGRRSLAIALSSLVAFGSFFITSFARSVEWLKPIDKASLFHYYNTSSVIREGLNYGNLIVLTVVTISALVLAVLIFARRDIKY